MYTQLYHADRRVADRKSHYGDKTVERPSYIHNGIFTTGKTS